MLEWSKWSMMVIWLWSKSATNLNKNLMVRWAGLPPCSNMRMIMSHWTAHRGGNDVNLPVPFMEAMLVAIMAMMFLNLPVPLMEATGKAFVSVFRILETVQQHLWCCRFECLSIWIDMNGMEVNIWPCAPSLRCVGRKRWMHHISPPTQMYRNWRVRAINILKVQKHNFQMAWLYLPDQSWFWQHGNWEMVWWRHRCWHVSWMWPDQIKVFMCVKSWFQEGWRPLS